MMDALAILEGGQPKLLAVLEEGQSRKIAAQRSRFWALFKFPI
jgi:hypothetical protein